MEKIVYIIGAGFSAPLNVPVMGNFYQKSKDLFVSNPSSYQHFREVFDVVDKLSSAKNYYESDLFNIEEILSIIEMNNFLGSNEISVDMTKFITDVINEYTPIYKRTEVFNAYWETVMADLNGERLTLYKYFVASLLRLNFVRSKSDKFKTLRDFDFCAEQVCHGAVYSVLSLNYDLVLERAADALVGKKSCDERFTFEKDNFDPAWSSVHLAKLHGCASGGELVPPTWAKGTHKSIRAIWANAFKILSEANHIRFVGYSLPVTDSYLKYLLKSAVVHSFNLKSIDVICLDGDGKTRSRYDEFFKYRNYRFKNRSFVDYLKLLKANTHKVVGVNNEVFPMNSLENTHHEFMEKNSISELS